MAEGSGGRQEKGRNGGEKKTLCGRWGGGEGWHPAGGSAGCGSAASAPLRRGSPWMPLRRLRPAGLPLGPEGSAAAPAGGSARGELRGGAGGGWQRLRPADPGSALGARSCRGDGGFLAKCGVSGGWRGGGREGKRSVTATSVFAGVSDATRRSSASACSCRQPLGPGREGGWCFASLETLSVECKRVLKP